MSDAAEPGPRLRRGLSVITMTETYSTELDDGRVRGPVERDLQVNNRTYWCRHDGPGAVEWACRLLEHLATSMPLDVVRTVVEPPSDAFWHTFLTYPSDAIRPTVAECGHLAHHWDYTPSGRYHDGIHTPPDAEDDQPDPWFVDPIVDVDEFGERRSSRSYFHHHIWLVGGAWTHAEAEAVEEGTRVPGPFHVLGPDGTIRPPHPWDPDGNLLDDLD